MKSVIVFTIHRSASMFLFKLTKNISRQFSIPYHSVNDQSFPDEHAYRKNPAVFSQRQGCFCPVRFYVNIPDLDQYKVILHLRDPRDVLTSWYYSKSYSHPRRENEFTASDEERARWIEEGVDAHVLHDAKGVLIRYQEYCDHLLGKPNVTLLKYEDMVLHFDRWLQEYLAVFPSAESVTKTLHRQVYYKYLLLRHGWKFRQRKENVNRHVRQIFPGDHKRKLKPETIEELNGKFAQVLQQLDYDL